jgi:Protein kinase domain
LGCTTAAWLGAGVQFPVPTCHSCDRPLADSDRFCGTCGAPVKRAGPISSDAETVAFVGNPDDQTRLQSVGFSSPAGWLSSSSDSGHGRFEPGTLLAGRYRIVDRKGQGGMGEVYRADDLKLGQPVAVKFLPASLEADPIRLAQFHSEVRLARQVAHKNVCRMYDVGEVDGLPFLTMEYVDGEDLASLLRRIGRLPEDKALDLARQLCAGLAAAHERGILHRDLKPANVMIDGQGQVRITDFGLAAVAGAAGQSRAGTPGYMAPELLAGGDATVASDVYALGLVLYELFTGRRAYAAQTIADLVRQQNETPLTRPSTVIRDLDPAIERTIMRALDRDPALRPKSALAVAASLPGGDPLAAALAAGETPSPEMVAAAGERSGIARSYAVAGTIGVILLLVAAAFVSLQRRTLSHATPDKPPAVLLDRAQQVLEAAGYPTRLSGDRWEFSPDNDLLAYAIEHRDTLGGDIFTARPGLLRFSLRTSPRALAPLNPLGAVTMRDPPFELSGMTQVVLDAAGRLMTLHVVPPQKDVTAAASPVDWSVLFRLAGLDQPTFREVPPQWLPRGDADTRVAWVGAMPGGPPQIRIEAAAWHGRPIYFQVIGPWTRADRMDEAPVGRGARQLNAFASMATAFLILAALFVARMNVRAGRGDWTGAWRLAAVAVVGQLITWAFNDPHMGNPSMEVNRFFSSIGEALFAGGLLFVMYLAVEPAVRRYWPDSLLGWTRLLRGRFVDARVGRDVLVGLAAGALTQLLLSARDPLQGLAGAHYPAATFGNTRYFEGSRYVLGYFASILAFQAVFNAMWCIFAIVGLKRLFKGMWLVGVAATVVFTFLAARDIFVGSPGNQWINLAFAMAVVAIVTVVAIRVGLLATSACFLATLVISATPWTFDTGAWYFQQSAVSLILISALALFAGHAARTGAAAG